MNIIRIFSGSELRITISLYVNINVLVMIFNVICWLDNLQMLIVRRKGSQDNHYQCRNKIIWFPAVFYEHPFCSIAKTSKIMMHGDWMSYINIYWWANTMGCNVLAGYSVDAIEWSCIEMINSISALSLFWCTYFYRNVFILNIVSQIHFYISNLIIV